MYRSKKRLCSGDQEYLKEKRPVNARVDGAVHFAGLFPAHDGADEYQSSPWFFPIDRRF